MFPRCGGTCLRLRVDAYCNIEVIQKYLETYGMGVMSRWLVNDVIAFESTFGEESCT